VGPLPAGIGALPPPVLAFASASMLESWGAYVASRLPTRPYDTKYPAHRFRGPGLEARLALDTMESEARRDLELCRGPKHARCARDLRACLTSIVACRRALDEGDAARAALTFESARARIHAAQTALYESLRASARMKVLAPRGGKGRARRLPGRSDTKASDELLAGVRNYLNANPAEKSRSSISLGAEFGPKVGLEPDYARKLIATARRRGTLPR
jgi:hypothetical protein